MSADRSREGLGRFLDFVGEKGLIPTSTAQTRKASALKLLSILSDDEAKDVTLVNVDDLVLRFSNLHGQSYNPGSLSSYRSRLKSSLADFDSYLSNPLAFRPTSAQRERSQKIPKKAVIEENVSKTVLRSDVSRAPSSPVMAGANVMPIPIRADLTILIHGLPHDLTASEAKKISGVINALAEAV